MKGKALLFVCLLVLLSPAVFALTWQTPYWLPVGTSDPNSINFGGSANAASGSFGSIDYSVNYKAELRASSGAVIKTLANKQVDVSQYNGYETVAITKNDYVNPGTYYVVFTLSDSHETRSKQITLIVKSTPSNTNPTITCPGAKTIVEGQNLEFYVSGADADGDALTFSATNLPSGASFDASSRKFSWLPGYDQSGSYSVVFTIKDTKGGSATCTTPITVQDYNRCPVFTPIGHKTVMAGQTLMFNVAATDADGDALTFSASGSPLSGGATFDPTTRTFTWTPVQGDVGDFLVTFSVTDGKCAQPIAQTITIYVTAKNVPQANLTAVPSTGPEGTTVTFSCTATGGDAPLTYSINFGDGSASVTSATATHKYDFAGKYTASCKVTDADSDSSTATAVVNITDNKPVVALVANTTSGNNPLSVAFDCQVSGGNSPFASYLIDFGDGSSATKQKADHTYASKGVYVATCTVVDFDGDLGTGSVGITVNETKPNTCPVLASVGNKKVSVGASLSFTLLASDAEGDKLSFSADAPFTQFLNSATGSFTWTPVALQVGNHSATFRVTDGNCEDTETIIIEVTKFQPLIQCSDTIDNDGDGKIDLNDPGCANAQDDNETDASQNNTAPKADFTWTPLAPEAGQSVTFNSTSTDAENDKLNCSWDFDKDGFEDSSKCTETKVFTEPGVYPVKLTVTDGKLSDSITKNVTVSGQLNVTNISCYSPVVEKNLQTCSVKIEGNNKMAVGSVNVKLHLLNGTFLKNCITDQITGNCVVTFPSGEVGTYTVYATAEKTGWKPDLDKTPTATYDVFAKKYTISNLAVYNNPAFTVEDYDFFRYESMYVHFIVLDDAGQPTDGVVTSVSLVSPPGGVAWFNKFNYTGAAAKGNYYYDLKIPKTHDFLGNSQVFTFAFNFTDKSGSQMVVQVTIRNNLPVINSSIQSEFNKTFASKTAISLTPYEYDVEDAGSALTWSVTGVDASVAFVTVDAGDLLTIVPVSQGYDVVTLLLKDLNGATASVDVPINTGTLSLPQCGDSKDNDGDGKVDMFDPGCSSPADDNETDPSVAAQCADGIDNDGDGKVDMFDPGCSNLSDNDESDPAVLPQCSDGKDNDGDSLVDLNDPGCVNSSDNDETNAVTLPQCADSVDNDGDGKIDMSDPGCANSADNNETDPTVAPQCSDGIDNDGDGKVDMFDPGCSSVGDNDETDLIVQPQCNDGVDNDGDGKVDLADAGCSSLSDNNESDDPVVLPQCADSKDNDGDGKIDMSDPGCSSGLDNDETDVFGNQPPVASINLSRSTGAPSLVVTVDGSASYDPDGSIVGYSWIILGPNNYTYSNANVSGKPGSFQVKFNNIGVYEIRLIVVDDKGASGMKVSRVTISTSIPQCDNGIDDDGDGKVDLADPHCADKNDNLESEMVLQKKAKVFRDQDDLFVTRIDMNGFDVESAAVGPGGYLQLSVGIENNLKMTLDDIKVSASVDELGIYDSDLLRELDSGDSATVVFNLDIPDYAVAGIYDVRFVISNNDVRRVKYRTIVIA
jgi:PKD repeat protein